MKRIVRFAWALLTVLVASSAFPQIIGERPVSTPAYEASTWSPFVPAIASDGNGFLAVWIDGRDRPSVFASRIDRDGTVLDPLGIYIARSDGFPADVAWDGYSYVVVWRDPTRSIVATTIASDGTIAAPPRVIPQQFQVTEPQPSRVASNGKVSVVTTDLGYVVLDLDLHVIEVSPVFSGYMEVFLTGIDEFTIRAGNGTVTLRRLDSSGHLLSSKTRTQTADFDGAIRCHQSNCIEVVSDVQGRLQAASYDPAAQTTGIPIDLSIVNVNVNFTLLATPDGFLLITGDDITQHFDLHGLPNGPPVLQCCQPVNGIEAHIAAASNGSDVAVLWPERTGNLGVTMASWTNAGKRNVATSATAQVRPAIAGSGANYLVAWSESDGVYEGRVSGDGAPLDGRGRLIEPVPQVTFPYPHTPDLFESIAFDATSYLLAASTTYDPTSETPRGEILTARIDPATGAILARTTICGSDMRIASNGSSTVAAWVDCTGGLDLAFLDANGALASMPVTVATPYISNLPFYGIYVAKPSLAWNGTEWLVTWEEQSTVAGYTGPGFAPYFRTSGLRGARFSGALTPLDTLSIPIATGLFDVNMSSRVASDGHDFLIAWSLDYGFTQARRISASGALSEVLFTLPGGVQDLLWDGVSYALAWAARLDRVYGTPVDLFLLRLSSSGTVLDTSAISVTPDDERSAALVSTGTGRLLAAYTRVAHEPLYGGVERVFIAAPRPARGRAVGITP